MKLIMIDHDEHGVWYFTTKAKAAKYIETSPSYLDLCIKLKRPCKDWTIEEIESDDVICKYIDPDKK